MSSDAKQSLQPWLLIGERRRRTLEERVRSAAERWAARWVTPAAAPAVTIELAMARASGEVPERRSADYGVRNRGGEWLAHLAIPRGLAAWAAGLGAVEFATLAEANNASVAAQLELDLLRAFWGALAPAPTAGDAVLERLDTTAAQAVRAALLRRSVHFCCGFSSNSAVVIAGTLSAGVVSALLGERRMPFVGEPLNSRRAAIVLAPVPVDCHLGSLQLPVRDLHSLCPGDVLVTDVTLDSLVELRVRGKNTMIAVGAIGESDGHRAIKLETANRG
jgi:hypothetical protein